jgi:uncharacterized protein (TIGR02145 family)
MTISRSLLIGIFAVSVCVAQNVIYIRGTVTDTGGTPIPGAMVRLENAGWATITQVNGNFYLGNVGVLRQDNQSLPQKLSARIHNGLLSINVAEKSVVEITAFDLTGKALSTVQKTMEAGNHSLALPTMGAGVHLYKVQAGSSEFLIKSHSFGKVSGGATVSIQGSFSNAIVKQTKSNAVINDVIAATKGGYLNYRVTVTNSETSGVVIKMIVCADSVTDADGNVYQAVKIGNQMWTVENLRVTKFNDGSAILHVLDSAAWYNRTTPCYCYYNNTTNADSIKKFGALYNWYTVNTGKLAPAGWHISADTERETLQNFLIANGYNWDGTTTVNKIAKSMAAKTDWIPYSSGEGTIGNDLTKNNSSGFSALPGGCRNYDGNFINLGFYGLWWGAIEQGASFAYYYGLYSDLYAIRRGYGLKSCGFSVRLVRDSI